jgi:hypothetical protein
MPYIRIDSHRSRGYVLGACQDPTSAHWSMERHATGGFYLVSDADLDRLARSRKIDKRIRFTQVVKVDDLRPCTP